MLGHRTLNVADYLSILKRRWWIVAIPAIILPILAVGATYFITPEYVSTTLVLVDQQKVSGDYVKSLGVAPLDSRLAYIQTTVLSRSSLEPIINKYNLYADQHLSMDAKIELIRTKALKVTPVQSELARANGLPGFSISFTASDPHTAQQVCTDITGLFTSVNAKSREDSAEESTGFLQERLDDAKRSLDDQDKKIADFQKQYMGMLPSDTSGNMGVMSSMNSQLDATTQNIQSLQQGKSVYEALLSAQQAQSTPSEVAAKAPQAEQAELDSLEAKKADLLTRYTPDYPEVKETDRRINELRAELAKAAANPQPIAPATPTPSRPESMGMVQLRAQLRGIDAQILAKQKEQNHLQSQIQAYEGRIQASPQVEEQYKELTRDYDTDQASYNSLRAEMNQAQMTTDLEHSQEGETFSLLDEATLPTDPISPKVSVFGAAGAVGGILLGLAIVALLEYRDTALRTEAEVWDFTHLPTLAVIAWSGQIVDSTPAAGGRLKRLFSRKPSKDMLANAQG
jgi:polysaccharide chain length determinant protein (PEP-CTERM system associated)